MQATKIEHPVDVWQVMEMPYQDEEAIMMEDDIEITDWVIEALFTDNRMGETDPDELGDFWVSNGGITLCPTRYWGNILFTLLPDFNGNNHACSIPL